MLISSVQLMACIGIAYLAVTVVGGNLLKYFNWLCNITRYVICWTIITVARKLSIAE